MSKSQMAGIGPNIPEYACRFASLSMPKAAVAVTLSEFLVA